MYNGHVPASVVATRTLMLHVLCREPRDTLTLISYSVFGRSSSSFAVVMVTLT